ncbi:SDR family NAD(P)-dependent oxidoreductase [Candidatus Pacearchaeota archaeon]|nr:SDR family NAD(P)-dependent oxidoreductase [Candidatus Pacearchaeota archaeon]
MKVLVTGMTGFIGGELAQRLVTEGHDVYGIVQPVSESGRNFSSIDNIKNKVKLVTCDLRDYISVKTAIKKIQPDVVMHLAALAPVMFSFESPLVYQDTNIIGTINLIDVIMDLYGPEKVRFVAASTAEVYGIQDENKPFTENLRLEPSSPYAVSKAAMDMHIRMLFKVYNFNGVIFRGSNVFGRKHDASRLTEYLIKEMIDGKDIYIGAPDSVRDYIYIDDHVDAYMLAMKTPQVRGEVFNIAGGQGFTNKEWVTKIAQLLNFPLEKIHFGQYPPGYPERPLKSDQPYLVLDDSKIRRVLGWQKKVLPEEGLKRTIAHWKNKIGEKKAFDKALKIKEILES